MRSPRVVLAAVAMILALGLPWGATGATTALTGWISPPWCTYDADGWMICDPGSIDYWFTVVPGSSYAGFQSSARVTLVLGLVLVAWWWRRGGSWQLPTAAALQVVAVALAGATLRSGAMAAVVAAVLLLLEAGTLRRRRTAVPAATG